MVVVGIVSAVPAAGAERIGLGPLQLFVGGEASASIADKDRGFFNAEDYGDDTLRLVRARLLFELRAGEHVAALGEVRHTNYDHTQFYALYLRLRPASGVPLDFQAGMVPPVFGSFPRRAYATDNPLIGLPLGYQYLTSLRPDAAPDNANELVAMKGWGWSPYYPTGASSTREGLPLVEVGRWDTGLQARYKTDAVEAAIGVGQGSPSDPRTLDNNSGKSVSARVAWTPTMGLVAGASVAQGRYLDAALETGGVPRRQRVWGADVDYSRGHWMLHAEGLHSSWDAPWGTGTIAATGIWIEGRLKVAPGVSLAARADHLSFSDVTTSTGLQSWDAPVTRLEGAVDWSVWRNVLLKVGLQHDRRFGGGPVPRQTFLAGQMVVWF
jgi:hypothetical protein